MKIRKLFGCLLAGLLFFAAEASSQQTFPLSIRYVKGRPGAGFDANLVIGGFVKNITAAGVVTIQNDDNAGSTREIQLTTGGGGSSISTGTANPTGGSAGDVYLQLDASDEVQSIWQNVSGTWTEYEIPTAGTSTDDQTAAEVPTTTTDFDGSLSGADTNVQLALNTLDDADVDISSNTPSNVTVGSGSSGSTGDVSDAGHVHGNAADIHTTSAAASQGSDARILQLSSLTPPLTTPVIGTIISFKTPSPLTHSNQAGVFLRISGNNYNLIRSPSHTIMTSALSPDTPYVVSYNGSNFHFIDTTLGVPPGGSAGQVLKKDSGTDFDFDWADDDNTFLGGSDTPNSYSGEARRHTRVNSAETALEFVNEPVVTNPIPQVGRIPTVSDSSPVLVFLTHDEIGGARDDATLTVARDGAWCGYSDGSLFGTFGAISETSPITTLLGVWDPEDSDCTLSEVYTTNDGWLDTQSTIVGTVSGSTFSCNLGVRYQNHGHFVKRITSCTALEEISLGDLTINFLDGGSPALAYWNDGDLVHRAGLYEKVGTPPVYHDLAPPEDAHKTGEGSAACGDSEPPTAAGQLCVTSDGRGYFAMPRTSLITTDATISVAGIGSDLFVPDIYETSDLMSRTDLTDGEFIYIKTTQDFYQFQDPNFEVVTWREAWQYAIDNVGDTTARQGFLTSIFLGEFASENEVIRDRDGYTDDSVEYYFLYSDFGTLIHITAFTNSVRSTINEGFAWRGPVIIPEEVLDVVSPNPTGALDESMDSVLIGSRRYSVIVRPGSNGILRDPTVVDWTLGVMAFNGNAYRVNRDHPTTSPPTATYDEIYVGTILRFNGGNSEPGRGFRGVFHGDSDVHSPANGNVYLNRDTHHWRIYLNGSWRDLDVSTIFYAAEDASPRPWKGYHGSEYWAVRSVDDVNEYVAWGNSLYITESFDAGATTYEYHWENIVPNAPTLSSDDANLLSQLHELEAADATLTAGTIGTNIIGWTSSGSGEGSIDPAVPSGSDLIQISRITTDETDTDIRNRLYVVATEDSGDEKYDGAQVRLTVDGNFRVFQLQELNYVLNNQRYVSTETLPQDFHFDANEDIEINIENPDSDNELTFGTPWLWHVPFSGESGGMGTGDITSITTPTASGIELSGCDSGDCVIALDVDGMDSLNLNGLSANDDVIVADGTTEYKATLSNLALYIFSRIDNLTQVTALEANDKFAFADDSDSNNPKEVEADDLSNFIGERLAGDNLAYDATTNQLNAAGILLQKHLASSSTEVDLDNATWVDLITQSITVSGSTDRVYVDAIVPMEFLGGTAICDLRVTRDGSIVGAESRGDAFVQGEIHQVAIRVIDTPGSAGTFEYKIQGQDDQPLGTNNCNAMPDRTTAFATFEVLGVNP